MPRLKLDDSDFDPDELDVEYEDGEGYQNYDGEQPPSGTILNGRVKKSWWTYSSNDTPMIKVLWEAAGNTGELEEYNGCPIWDNLVFTPKAAFRYQPFLELFGLGVRDIKNKMFAASEDDNVGAPIEKIGKWVPGSDDADCAVMVKREKYQGEWQVRVGRYLATVDEGAEDDSEPEPGSVRQRMSKRGGTASKRPARRSRAAEPEPDEDEDEDDDSDEDDDDDGPDSAPPAKSSRRPASKAPSKGKAPARSRGGRKVSGDDPPF